MANKNQAHPAGSSTDDFIVLIDHHFNDVNNNEMNEVLTAWKQWKCQHTLYSDIAEYSKLKKWKMEDRNLKRYLANVNQALKALKEIDETNAFDKIDKEDIKHHILLILKINLLRLDISQLKRIQLGQGISRETDITNKQKQFRHELDHLEKELREIKYTKKIDKQDYPDLYDILKKHEKYTIHYKRHFGRLSKTGSVSSAVGSSYGLLTTLNKAVPGVIPITQAAGSVLIAIPIVGSILTAIPLVLRAIKTWVKDQSTFKKSMATGIAILVIGGILTAGFLPIAAAGIGAALAGLGVIVNNIIPWWKSNQAVNICQNEAALLEKRINELKLITDPKDIILEENEKSAFLKKIEDYLISHLNDKNYPTKADIEAAKKCILEGSFDAISNNSLLKLVMNNPVDIHSSKKYLIELAKEHRNHLNDTLGTLKEQHRTKLTNMITGTASFIGAVLLCIPFPPVMLAGAALIAASSLVALVVKFELITKAKNFFSRLFSSTPAPSEAIDEPDHAKKNKTSIKLESRQALQRKIQPPIPAGTKEAKPELPKPSAANDAYASWHNGKKPSETQKKITFSLSPRQKKMSVNDSHFGDKPTDENDPNSSNKKH